MWEMFTNIYPYENCEDKFSLIFMIVSKKLNPYLYCTKYQFSNNQYCNFYQKCLSFQPESRPCLNNIKHFLLNLSYSFCNYNYSNYY